MTDQSITCRDCGTPFVFTAGEATFYESRGYSVPQRCPACRETRKAQRNGQDGDSSGFSRSSYGSSAPRDMHDAVCSSCGQETQVPFKPSMNKPVYCRSCFQAQRSSY